MAYAIDVSKILADTLQRFSTLNPHQLAGHLANLDFWLTEIAHSTSLIDAYRKRFEAMKSAQAKEARNRRTDVPGVEDETFLATPPKSVPDGQLKAARAELLDAAYKFLIRCHKTDLLDEQALRKALASIGTGVDPNDIAK